MDKLFIAALKIEATIGIHPEERHAPQAIVIDMTLTTDTRKVAKSDCIADTIDYDTVIKHVQKWASEKPFQLIESLAETLANNLLHTFFQVHTLRLRVRKFPKNLPIAAAGVIIERNRIER